MLRRSLAALATAVSALGVVALPTAGPASAAGVCTLTPPSRIAIYADFTELPTSITGDCQPNGYGYWSTPGGFNSNEDPRFATAQFGAFFGPTTPTIDVPDVMDHYGKQTWGGDEAGSDDQCEEGSAVARTFAQRAKARTAHRAETTAAAPCGDLTQNSPVSDIRLGGYASLSGTRSGSRITFTAGSGGWSPSSNKLVVRPRVSGEIQTQYADGSWHRVGNPFTTGTNGKATIVATVPATRTFRYAMYSTASYFDRVSTAITR